MRVTKEQFNKLNQLDRIEFRQRYAELSKNIDSLASTAACQILAFFAVILIADIWRALHTGNWFNINLYIIITKLSIVYILVTFPIDLINILFWFKNRNLLLKEYFSVEIKRRKK